MKQKGYDLMDNLDKIKKELYSMSKKEREALAGELESKLSEKQQESLKQMLSSKSGKAELEGLLKELGIDSVKSANKLDSAQVKKKIREILG